LERLLRWRRFPSIRFDSSSALAQTAAKLSGQITSAEEGNMEGVVVSAKKAGSTITISVVSDAQGNFSFPASKIEPGEYSLRIRAIGFELDSPRTVTVGAETAEVPRNSGRPATSRHNIPVANGLQASRARRSRKPSWIAAPAATPMSAYAKSAHSVDEWIGVLQRNGQLRAWHHAI
jgi:hypothetical protein